MILFNKPYRASREKEFIQDVLDGDTFYGCGKYTDQATQELCKIFGTNNILLTDSCSSALDIIALKLRKDFPCPNANIVLPSYTFSSTANAFAKVGFKIRFCDVGGPDMVCNVDNISSRIDSDTIAVAVIHYGLNVAPVDAIRRFCDQNGVFLVEDAAQAVGAKYKNRKLGTFGHFGAISFHETKNIHSGLGGAVIFEDSALELELTAIWERGTNRQAKLRGVVDKYTWTEIGGSYYPTELTAALLYAQLLDLSKNIEIRKKIYEAYCTALLPRVGSNVRYFSTVKSGIVSNYHSMYVIVDDPDEVFSKFQQSEIAAYIGYVPLHSSPMGLKLNEGVLEHFPNTDDYAPHIVRLPYHHELEREHIEAIVSIF